MSGKPKARAEVLLAGESKSPRHAERMPDLPSLCRSIFEGSPLPMATVEGAKHVLLYANPAFCRLASRTEDELVGKPFAEIVPEDGCLSILEKVYRTGKAETHTGTEHQVAEAAYWSYAMWPVLGVDEDPVGITIQVTETGRFHQQVTAMNQELLLSAVRQHELTEVAERLNTQLQMEIADRKRIEEALLISEKLAATSRLAETMAHEINNPLAALTNLAYLLAPLQTSPAAEGYISTIQEQLRRLSRIATQMLKFHRDSNNPTEFKLSAVLGEVVDFYGPQAQKQGVIINERLETEGNVAGFRGEITQLVSNLLLNAIEATPCGGRVTAHLYPAPPWLCATHNRCGYCLCIADTGIGIDSQHVARIFEPFFTTKGDKGTGLGLWLCKGIVNRVGGIIRVWSTRRPNCSGTCISVFLPAEEATFAPLRRRYERLTPAA